MSVNRNNLCPNCGAKLSGLELKCPECGYVLTSETTTSQNTTESILSLQEKLSAVDKVFTPGASSSKKKATIINTFPIPNTTESLIRLLHLSYTNYEASRETGDKKLSMAWLGKAIESYRRLEKHQTDPLVADALMHYKALGDKDAFTKLSGSRSKKRWTIISCLAALALLAAFILWYDWPGLLVKNDRSEAAVRLLSFMGRDVQAVEVLIRENHFEEAAQLMISQNRLVEAVALLAQNGMIKEALIMAGRTNSAEAIHSCVDEIEKCCQIGFREKWHLEDGYCLTDHDKTLVKVYDHNQFRVSEKYDLEKKTIVWYDWFNAWQYKVITQPHIFRHSLFDEVYGGTIWGCDAPVTLNRDSMERMTHFLCGKFSFDFQYDFSQVIRSEKGFCNQTQLYEIRYKYLPNSDLLESVTTSYLLNDEELSKQFDGKVPESQKYWTRPYSTRWDYVYDSGRLIEIKRSYIYYNGIDAKYTFDYYDNLRIMNTFNYDDKDGKEVIKPDSNHYIDLFADGVIVETMSASF